MEIWTAAKDDRKKARFPSLFDASGHYKMLRIRFALKNTGKAAAEKAFVFIYTNDPITPTRSSFYQEKDYTGEDGFNYVTGGIQFDYPFPPNFTLPGSVSLRLLNDFDPSIQTGLYPVILKISYGVEEPVTSRFKLHIAPIPIAIPFAADEDVEDDSVRPATTGLGNQGIPKQ